MYMSSVKSGERQRPERRRGARVCYGVVRSVRLSKLSSVIISTKLKCNRNQIRRPKRAAGRLEHSSNPPPPFQIVESIQRKPVEKLYGGAGPKVHGPTNERRKRKFSSVQMSICSSTGASTITSWSIEALARNAPGKARRRKRSVNGLCCLYKKRRSCSHRVRYPKGITDRNESKDTARGLISREPPLRPQPVEQSGTGRG